VSNFGDLLGPVIVRALVREFGLRADAGDARLLAIGSILHLAEFGDVVWGPGLNAKAGTELSSLPTLDVRAVRGPFTRALLEQRFGQPAPEVYGDPGLLLGALSPRLVVAPERRRRALSIVPNLNELAEVHDRDNVVNPRWPLRRVLSLIATSRLVVGSSLHGIIVAEALGVPARAVRTSAESALKYQDYYVSTGRDPETVLADDVAEAVARGGVAPPRWDPVPLLSAFPRDLWTASSREPDAVIERLAERFGTIAGRSAEGFVRTRRAGIDPAEARA
jgi:pyruvyltransferase